MTRCAVIAVIGAPNAGKSTLVNALVGAKVSIVTHKVQTTRARVRGIAVDGDAQLVFIDTPGIFAPRRKLDEAMVAAAWEGLDGADATLLVVDAAAELAVRGRGASPAARRAAADTAAIVESMKARGAKATLILNKIDQVDRPRLLTLIESYNATGLFDGVFLIAASSGDGLADLRAGLDARAPAGPWLYPEDQLSDISDRLMAAETTREKIYLRLHQELPYESTVETEEWTRTGKGDLRIAQTIYVSRESHRPIVLGKGGQTLKAIGEAARNELAEMLGVPVHLFLTVKVREGWAVERERLRALGLDV